MVKIKGVVETINQKRISFGSANGKIPPKTETEYQIRVKSDIDWVDHNIHGKYSTSTRQLEGIFLFTIDDAEIIYPIGKEVVLDIRT